MRHQSRVSQHRRPCSTLRTLTSSHSRETHDTSLQQHSTLDLMQLSYLILLAADSHGNQPSEQRTGPG